MQDLTLKMTLKTQLIIESYILVGYIIKVEGLS